MQKLAKDLNRHFKIELNGMAYVMGWMFVSLQNSHIKVLMLHVMVFGNGALGR